MNHDIALSDTSLQYIRQMDLSYSWWLFLWTGLNAALTKHWRKDQSLLNFLSIARVDVVKILVLSPLFRMCHLSPVPSLHSHPAVTVKAFQKPTNFLWEVLLSLSGQKQLNLFCKGPDSNYFRLCKPQPVSVALSYFFFSFFLISF